MTAIREYVLCDDGSITCKNYAGMFIFLNDGEAKYALDKECLQHLVVMLIEEDIIKKEDLETMLL